MSENGWFNELAGSYFISSEKGVYYIKRNKISRLTSVPTMGISICDGHLYTAVSNEFFSYIFSFEINRDGSPKLKYPRLIYKSKQNSSSDRIHQIYASHEHIWIAHTAKNSLVKICSKSGRKLSEYIPFTDKFGVPLKDGFNHINSVLEIADCILFVAYKAGSGSMLGLIFNNKLFGYLYPNQGVHDIILSDGNLFFCDTFGNQRDVGGKLIKNGKTVDQEFFNKLPGQIPRGIGIKDKEILLGHSHKGNRAERFKGKGRLLLLKNDRVVQTKDTPFAQVYQIIVDEELGSLEQKLDGEQVKNYFDKYLGEPDINEDILHI